jgi:hypothetical protein
MGFSVFGIVGPLDATVVRVFYNIDDVRGKRGI